MKSFKNHQALTANQIREIIGSRTLTGIDGGNIVECSACHIEDSDTGEIVVYGGDSIDPRSTASIEFDGCSFAMWYCENTGFDNGEAIYTIFGDIQ